MDMIKAATSPASPKNPTSKPSRSLYSKTQ